jgi:hypothetical protein
MGLNSDNLVSNSDGIASVMKVPSSAYLNFKEQTTILLYIFIPPIQQQQTTPLNLNLNCIK